MSRSTLPARLSAPARREHLEGDVAVGGVDHQLGAGGRVGEGGQGDARVGGVPGGERRVAHAVRLGAGEGRLRVAGADHHGVAELVEAAGDRLADHAGAENCDVHGSFLRRARGRQVCLPSTWTLADRSVYYQHVPPPSARRAHPRHRLPALLRPRHPRRRRGPDHRRVGRGQGDLLQALPGQGRPRGRLPRHGRRDLDRPAARGGRGGRPGPGRPAGRALRRARLGLPPGRLPRLRLHQRCRRGGARARRCTTAPSRTSTRCWPGCASLAAEAGASDPDGLARSLTLLLDGGLASGALDADPEAATQARAAAALLVGSTVGSRLTKFEICHSSVHDGA